MAEPTQYSFSFAEIAKLMFESSSIHEGKWVVGLEFGVIVGPVGLKPGEGFPGAVITANKLMLSAITNEDHPPNLVFDAAVLNPKKAKQDR
jgi:hypothetical protein